MKEKKIEIHNLGKKIYFLCYSRPRYKLEISNMIYGCESKGIYPEIKKLEKKEWIKKADKKIIDEFNKQKHSDKLDLSSQNAEKRKYYYADNKPIYEDIINFLKKQNIDLNEKEKLVLEKLTNKLSRTIAEIMIMHVDLKENVDLFEKFREYLNIWCVFFLTSLKYLDESPKILLKSFFRGYKNKEYLDFAKDSKGYENVLMMQKLTNLNPYHTEIINGNLYMLITTIRFKELSTFIEDKKTINPDFVNKFEKEVKTALNKVFSNEENKE